jgi:hypothetical protein
MEASDADGGAAALDLLQSTYAFADRMCSTIRDWTNREARTAPAAALSLAGLAISCAERVQAEIEREFARVRAGAAPDDNGIVGYNTRIAVLQDISDVVEQSAHRSLHPVLSPTVNSLLSSLNIEGEVLVTCTRETASYELQFWRKDEFVALATPEVLGDVKLPFLIFLVPKPSLDWPIHYCLLFHEIGHAVFESRKLGRCFTITPPDEIAQGTPDDLGPAKYLERYELRLKWDKAIGQWIEEIFSDVFGVLSVGPAYLHSFCRVLGAKAPLTDCTSVHPPSALRISIMNALLEDRKMLAGIPAAVSAALHIWSTQSDGIVKSHDFTVDEKEVNEVVHDFARELVKAALGVVEEVVKKVELVLGPTIFTAEDGRRDLTRATRIASLNIPAIEEDEPPRLDGLDNPLSAARIFASNWLAYYLNERLVDHDRRDGMRQHGERLLNSLDAAEAIRAWRRASAE